MNDTFGVIVVVVDLERASNRSIGVAAGLSAITHLPAQLVTVASPGLGDQKDLTSLKRLATEHELHRCEPIVLHDIDPARAIAEHLSTLDGPLVVMSTAAHGPFGELVTASTAAAVLASVECPVLVLGPAVPTDYRPRRPQLVACVGPVTDEPGATETMRRWMNTFGGDNPWLVNVAEPGANRAGADAPESAAVHRMADLLARSGVSAEWEVLHDNDVVSGILGFGATLDDVIFVVTSERWTEPSRLHLHSVSRRLTHQSPNPVLVVPRANVQVG